MKNPSEILIACIINSLPSYFKELIEKLMLEKDYKGAKLVQDIQASFYETIICHLEYESLTKGDNLEEEPIKKAQIEKEFEDSVARMNECTRLFSEYNKNSKVYEVLSSINLKSDAHTLLKADKQLDNFLLENHSSSLSQFFGKYSEQLILEGKRQLDRINNNYGLRNQSEPELQNIDFPVNIFLKAENFALFEYLVEHYGSAKRPVDLSHIFRWMEESKLIAKRSGKLFREYCVNSDLVRGEFSRMADPDKDTRTPLNELYKTFNQTGVKTTK